MPVNNPSSNAGIDTIETPEKFQVLRFEPTSSEIKTDLSFTDADEANFFYNPDLTQPAWEWGAAYGEGPSGGLRSGKPEQYYYSSLQTYLEVQENAGATLSLRLKLDLNEETSDGLDVFVDGRPVYNSYSASDWQTISIPLDMGLRKVMIGFYTEAEDPDDAGYIYLDTFNSEGYGFKMWDCTTAEVWRPSTLEKHSHDWQKIHNKPATFTPAISGTPSEGDVVTYVSGVPTWEAP